MINRKMHVATHMCMQDTIINNNIGIKRDMLIDFSHCFTNKELKADTKISTTDIH